MWCDIITIQPPYSSLPRVILLTTQICYYIFLPYMQELQNGDGDLQDEQSRDFLRDLYFIPINL